MWNKRIRTKIFLAMLLATALPLAILSSIIFYQVTRAINEDKSFARIRVNQDLKGKVEDFLLNLNETAYQIYTNPFLPETIALNKSFLTDSQTYDTVRDLEQFFLSVYYQSRIKTIIGMYIIRNDGELLGNFYPAVHPQYTTSYYANLLEQVRSNQYRPMMLIHYQSQYKEPVIQFLYPVRYRGQPAGLLVIDVKETTFRDQVENYNVFYKGEIALVSSTDQVLYNTDPAKTGIQLKKSTDNGGKVMIETPRNEAGWRLLYQYRIDPEQILYRNLALAMIGISGLLAIILSLGLSFNLTKPIVELHRKMGRIQIGDFDARVDVKSQDEIGFLGNQFNQMAETIQQLIEHDLKLRLMNQTTQIKALQAQISPHFLFNTLQMMIGMAEVNSMPDLKLICQSLSSMYRYNMNIDKEWVRLREEIMHIRNYLVVINKRYSDTIRFRLYIEPEAYELLIPKLILQPIIENAVEHGLIPGTRRRSLLRMSVRADRDGNLLTIHVIDNGAGMERPDTIDLEAGMGLFHANTTPHQAEDIPIGLANVHARIRLICGQSYGITLTSRKGAGFCVTYYLPLKEASE